MKKGNVKDYLYKLPEIKRTSNIIIVEGEKCADAINQIIPTDKEKDYITTTNIGGAGRWKDDYNQFLQGKNVFIIPDNDSPGRDHANRIYWSLKSSGIESKVIELTDIDLLKTKTGIGKENKADIFDWFKANHTLDDLFGLINSTNGHFPGWLNKEIKPVNKPEIEKLYDEQEEILDTLFKFLQDRYAYNKLNDEILDLETKETINKLPNIKSHVIHLIYEKFKCKNQDFNKLHGEIIRKCKRFENFNTSFGLYRIEKDKDIYEIDKKIYYASPRDFQPVNVPVYNSILEENKIADRWKNLMSIFKDETLAFYAIQRFFRNLIRTIKADRENINPAFIIIKGMQGIGKDKTVIKYLISWLPCCYIIDNATGENLSDSRFYRALQKKILLVFPEMQKIDRADIKAVKNIVDTGRNIGFRPMRTNDYIEFPNYLNFIGSSNVHISDIVKDSEYRRWIELEIKDEFSNWKEIYKQINQVPIENLLETVSLDENERAENYIIKCQSEYIDFSPVELFWDENKDNITRKTEIKTSEIFTDYKAFCERNNFMPKNSIHFGREIKSMLEKTGYEHQKTHRLYKKIAIF